MMYKHRPGQYSWSLPTVVDMLSPGGWLICALAIVSAIVLLIWPIPQKEGLAFWIFAKTHQRLYEPMTAAWNSAQPPAQRVNLVLLSAGALQRRLLSGFLSDTPLPDLAETYVQIVAQAFMGPLEDVGLVDLTDILQAEGIDEQINAPSFAPWTSRGRIFGLPHDVHPVLLAYRADLVEAAGIDAGTSEGTAGVNLLAADDGLGSLTSGLAADRAPAPVADDGTMALLAELDAPSAPRAAAAQVARAAETVPVGGGTAAAIGSGSPSDEDSWLDTMANVSIRVAAAVVGDAPAAARMAAGTSEGTAGVNLLAEDDGLGSLTSGLAADRAPAPVADDGTMALLAELDAPSAPRVAAPVARAAEGAPVAGGTSSTGSASPVAEDSWLDTMADVGARVASAVVGADGVAAAPRMAAGTSEGTPGVNLLAEDDGLGSLTAGLAADRAPAPVADNGAPMALLAELDAPGAPRVAASPVARTVESVSPGMAAASGSASASTSDEDSWLDTMADVGGRVASSVAGVGRPAPVMAAGTDDLLAGDDGLGSLTAGLAADRGPVPTGAADDGSWMETVVGVTSMVSAFVAGEPMMQARTAPATVEPIRSSEGAPGVDLLAGDDDLGLGLVASRRNVDGWQAAAAADNPAMALLAEIDGPGPARGGDAVAVVDDWLVDVPTAPRPTAATSVTRSAAPVATASTGGPAAGRDLAAADGLDSLTAGLADDRGGASAGWGAPDADAGWLDTVSSVGGAVASLVVGGSGEPGPAAPSLGGASASAAVSSEGRAGVDPWPETTGWSDLTVRPRDDPPFHDGPADKATLDLLAELDAPAGPARPPAAVRTVSASSAPRRRPRSPRSRRGASPTSPAAEDGWMGTATSWMGVATNLVAGATEAPAPSIAEAAPLAPQTTSSRRRARDPRRRAQWSATPPARAAAAFSMVPADWSAPVRPGQPPKPPEPPPCLDGELCGDGELQAWRDANAAYNDLLMADDPLSVVSNRPRRRRALLHARGRRVPPRRRRPRFARRIADPDGPHGDRRAGVPIEVDGHPVGLAPLHVELTPGRHAVKVHGEGQSRPSASRRTSTPTSGASRRAAARSGT